MYENSDFVTLTCEVSMMFSSEPSAEETQSFCGSFALSVTVVCAIIRRIKSVAGSSLRSFVVRLNFSAGPLLRAEIIERESSILQSLADLVGSVLSRGRFPPA